MHGLAHRGALGGRRVGGVLAQHGHARGQGGVARVGGHAVLQVAQPGRVMRRRARQLAEPRPGLAVGVHALHAHSLGLKMPFCECLHFRSSMSTVVGLTTCQIEDGVSCAAGLEYAAHAELGLSEVSGGDRGQDSHANLQVLPGVTAVSCELHLRHDTRHSLHGRLHYLQLVLA